MAKFKSPGKVWEQMQVVQEDLLTADLDKLADITATATEINLIDGVTATTAELNKVAGLGATTAELDRVADKSASVVDETTSTLTLTAALHASRIVTLSRAAGVTVTLPAATGTGERYTIIVATTVTSVADIIQAASGSDSFVGGCVGVDTDGEGATGFTWNADAADDTITMDGTINGGVAGDKWEIIDYATGLFMVFGYITQNGGSEVTPFSAAV